MTQTDPVACIVTIVVSTVLTLHLLPHSNACHVKSLCKCIRRQLRKQTEAIKPPTVSGCVTTAPLINADDQITYYRAP